MSQNSQDNQSYPLRLPNYRFLHQGRFHPYPTFNRPQGTSAQEIDDIEITDASATLAGEVEPSAPTQDGPASQSQQANNEQGDADLANLAAVVDELQGTASERNTRRDETNIIVECFFPFYSIIVPNYPHFIGFCFSNASPSPNIRGIMRGRGRLPLT
ncbi:hypothetical protein BGW80DRAFT_1453672 [Lactifluus volemus]|nr:hypothetical protein BGW80DRAFT_1453672 [Lactifluus volemus]